MALPQPAGQAALGLFFDCPLRPTRVARGRRRRSTLSPAATTATSPCLDWFSTATARSTERPKERGIPAAYSSCPRGPAEYGRRVISTTSTAPLAAFPTPPDRGVNLNT